MLFIVNCCWNAVALANILATLSFLSLSVDSASQAQLSLLQKLRKLRYAQTSGFA